MPKARRKPTSDWNCREVLDAKAVSVGGESKCGFCGTRIRWIHLLEHDDWHRPVEAGCCCAVRFCSDYDAATAERETKNRVSRLKSFCDPSRWNQSQSNRANVWRWVKLPDGQRVRLTIFLKDGRYGIYFVDKKDNDDRYCHPDRYRSREEATAIAFETIENMK